MTRCKCLCDACSSHVCSVKASAGAGSRGESATPAPIDRQAGCPNIHSDPPVKNFYRRSGKSILRLLAPLPKSDVIKGRDFDLIVIDEVSP